MTNKRKMLLHICCAPCSTFPLKNLCENHQEFDITGYFYNPNIHPYKEFKKRLDTLKLFAEKTNLNLIVDSNYDIEDFIREQIKSIDSGKDRCLKCYTLRLKQVASFAKENNFDVFSTTLLVSPYQKHDLIKLSGEIISSELGVDFYYQDFREGWHEGVQISKDLELYRQPYCGCIFSEKERYYKKPKG